HRPAQARQGACPEQRCWPEERGEYESWIPPQMVGQRATLKPRPVGFRDNTTTYYLSQHAQRGTLAHRAQQAIRGETVSPVMPGRKEAGARSSRQRVR